MIVGINFFGWDAELDAHIGKNIGHNLERDLRGEPVEQLNKRKLITKSKPVVLLPAISNLKNIVGTEFRYLKELLLSILQNYTYPQEKRSFCIN